MIVIGGRAKTNDVGSLSNRVWRLGHANDYESKYYWDVDSISQMKVSREGHTALHYESRHYDISDKIFCFGGASKFGHDMEYYDVDKNCGYDMKEVMEGDHTFIKRPVIDFKDEDGNDIVYDVDENGAQQCWQ